MTGEAVYRISYYTGVQTVRLLHRIVRFLTRLFLPLRLILWRAVRALRRAFKPRRHREGLAGVRKRIVVGGHRITEAWGRHPLYAIGWALWLPIAALRHYKAFTRTVTMLGAIACAAALMIGTLRYWDNTTYALALTDSEGDVWGYVSDESVFQDGVAKAKERLGNTATEGVTAISPSLTLQMIRRADIWNGWQVCDRLLQLAKADVDEACGIYIDNAFYGAVRNRRGAEQMLSSILTEHCEGKADVTASFVETVELVDGWYAKTSIQSSETVRKQLTAEVTAEKYHTWQTGDTLSSVAAQYDISLSELLRNNPSASSGMQVGQTLVIQKAEPHLRVLVSGTVQYETEMPFTVQRVPDASMYEGNERVRVYGKNGTGRVTATVTYLDGVEQFSAITESQTLVKPVTQVIAYGTKQPIGAGKNYVWPTPCSRFVTQYFSLSGKRHLALDIWAKDMEGEDIVAADGGKVLIAEDPRGTTYWSYGKYIVIDHGGGYQTLYSHCSELLVKPGDTVSKGQLIAKVGHTGRATASHLHFEVLVNGKNVDPMLFY